MFPKLEDIISILLLTSMFPLWQMISFLKLAWSRQFYNIFNGLKVLEKRRELAPFD
jgi:hypothetical protein